jgi:hypothetical protein
MKRYEVKFQIDLRDTSNPAWLTKFINNIWDSDQMTRQESVVPDSIEVTEVPNA